MFVMKSDGFDEGRGCQNKACYDKMTVLTKMTFFMIFYVFFCLWENALSVSFG